MGLRKFIQSLFGTRASHAANKEADPDDLFGMSTAHVTMHAEVGYESVKKAGICFSDFDSTKFEQLVDDARSMAEIGDDSTIATKTTDDHGYDWIIVEDDDFESLVSSLYTITDEFMTQGYGSRLIAAVFGFTTTEGQRAYWIYSFKQGSFYPFCPENNVNDRESAREGKLKQILDGELDIEEDRGYWYPIWPSTPGNHPWE